MLAINKLTVRDRQDVVAERYPQPDPALVHRRLLSVVRQKPVQHDLLDVRKWQRNSRSLGACAALALIRRNSHAPYETIGRALGISGRAVHYWNTYATVPTVKHAEQLHALADLIRDAR